MPNMDGHEALSRIRRERPTVRVVISSGYSGESVSAGFGDESPDAFLAKPYELTRLQETLQTLL
jgi:CheY-like chemotaxis protein